MGNASLAAIPRKQCSYYQQVITNSTHATIAVGSTLALDVGATSIGGFPFSAAIIVSTTGNISCPQFACMTCNRQNNCPNTTTNTCRIECTAYDVGPATITISGPDCQGCTKSNTFTVDIVAASASE